MHFHRGILAIADTFGRHILQPTAEDVFAGSPPVAFTFGLGGLVIFPLRFGASALLTERAAPVELAENAAAAGAPILFTAATAYRAILKAGRGDLLSRLRIAVSAGRAPAQGNMAGCLRCHRGPAGERHRSHGNAPYVHLGHRR